MERTFESESNKGEKIKCTCGSDKFQQESTYIVVENVKLFKKDNGEFNVLSISIDEESIENPEYSNEYKCSECGEIYHIMSSE